MEHFLQSLIFHCRTKESSDFIKYPSVEFRGIFISKVFFHILIHRGKDMAPTSSFGKHWQDIRASPCPCVTAFIEGRIKLYRVFFPTWKERTLCFKWSELKKNKDHHLSQHNLSKLKHYFQFQKKITTVKILLSYMYLSCLIKYKSWKFTNIKRERSLSMKTQNQRFFQQTNGPSRWKVY